MTGCSQKENTASGPVTITVWHDKEDAVIAVLEEAVKPLQPDINVVFEKKSGMTESLKLVGNDKNAAPDMYFFAHDKIGVYAEMGVIAPITDFVDVSEQAGYVPITVRGATYKGNVYQMPLYFETLLFMYNKKYMKEADIPATTEQLYSYMERKTKYGHYGFVEQHSTPYYAAGWIHGFGGSILSEDGKPGLNTPETIKALTYHKKFVDYMPGETEYATVNTLFTEGIVYNIFPDSFATGKRFITDLPTTAQYDSLSVHGKRGGTIRGIMENLDYLLDLGVNCIYMNPIFAAGEYHKYDLIDYYHIDPAFGTDEEFRTLVKTAHSMGIRVMIDGVFNHCGWKFFAFRDAIEHGKASRYWDWFFRLQEPVIPLC